ncbi:MAG: hypothetical protein J6P50_02860 [Bacteroidales bacterium]|nr:hypothetical protein [Bacteroidales bacterium]
MHKFIFILVTVAALTASFNASAQQGQTSEMPDPMELAAKIADQMERDLELDVAQVFMIDTLYQHAYTEYYADVEKLSKAGVPSTSSQYLRTSDKWGDYIDKVLEKILTEQQWAKYLKGDGGRAKKQRDKRMASDKY